MDPAEALSTNRLLSSRAVEAAAKQAGFDLVGFARAEPLPPQFLREWLEAGFAADMDWMIERADERLDVSKLLPGARTVVSLACNYYFEEPPGQASPISVYARGRDYHATMKDRLRAFRRGLKGLAPRILTYGGVDFLPLAEKVWAARAGLGYVGKNACLITPEFGSYVVLTTLVLDHAVDRYADGPTEDRCGSCRACLNACPTEAIVSDGVVDARRCLSYQTIENRDGPVPVALRGAFGDTVFGCDICQDICPLNRAPLQGSPRFAPRAVATLGVRELAALTPEQYEALIPGTPLARAKYDGLRRNAAYALGASRDEGARPLLQRLTTDPSDFVADAARWALEQLPPAR